MENLKVGQEFKLVKSLIDNGLRYAKIEKGKCYISLKDFTRTIDMQAIYVPTKVIRSNLFVNNEDVKVLGVLRIKSLK